MDPNLDPSDPAAVALCFGLLSCPALLLVSCFLLGDLLLLGILMLLMGNTQCAHLCQARDEHERGNFTLVNAVVYNVGVESEGWTSSMYGEVARTSKIPRPGLYHWTYFNITSNLLHGIQKRYYILWRWKDSSLIYLRDALYSGLGWL